MKPKKQKLGIDVKGREELLAKKQKNQFQSLIRKIQTLDGYGARLRRSLDRYESMRATPGLEKYLPARSREIVRDIMLIRNLFNTIEYEAARSRNTDDMKIQLERIFARHPYLRGCLMSRRQMEQAFNDWQQRKKKEQKEVKDTKKLPNN